MTARLAEVPVVRVLYRLGPDRLVRITIALFLVAAWAQTILISRPDLIQPTTIGTDTSNYYAAGLRLNVGHQLYALVPGDREVPLEPPFWNVPLLSPPTIGALWRPIALLPGDLAMTAWWLVTLVVYTALVAWLLVRSSLRAVGLLFVLGTPAALSAWSGNINTLLAVVLVAAWLSHRRGNAVISGVLCAVAAALKVTPLFLVWWLIVCGRPRAVVAFGAAGVVILALTLVAAGPANVLAYLDVIRDTSTAGVTPVSLAGFLRNSGVPEAVSVAATPALIVLGAGVVWLLRSRPGAAFAVSVLVIVYGSPVVYMHTLAILVAMLAPALDLTSAPMRWRVRRSGEAASAPTPLGA